MVVDGWTLEHADGWYAADGHCVLIPHEDGWEVLAVGETGDRLRRAGFPLWEVIDMNRRTILEALDGILGCGTSISRDGQEYRVLDVPGLALQRSSGGAAEWAFWYAPDALDVEVDRVVDRLEDLRWPTRRAALARLTEELGHRRSAATARDIA